MIVERLGRFWVRCGHGSRANAAGYVSAPWQCKSVALVEHANKTYRQRASIRSVAA